MNSVITLPPGADIATFVLPDGRVEQRPTMQAKRLPLLGALLDEYLATLTPGSLEATTEHCIRVHIRHFKRLFGEKLRIGAIDRAAVQPYVDDRR